MSGWTTRLRVLMHGTDAARWRTVWVGAGMIAVVSGAFWGAWHPVPGLAPPTGALAWTVFVALFVLLTLMVIPVTQAAGVALHLNLATSWAVVAVGLAGGRAAGIAAVITGLVVWAVPWIEAQCWTVPRWQPWIRRWVAWLGNPDPDSAMQRALRRPGFVARVNAINALWLVAFANAGWALLGRLHGVGVVAAFGALVFAVNLASGLELAGHFPDRAARDTFLSTSLWQVQWQSWATEWTLGLVGWGAVQTWGWFGGALLFAVAHLLSRQLRQQRVLADRAAALAAERAASRTDPLTHLPNRRALEEYVARLTAAAMPCVVAIADADHFKRVNDTWGHDAGDAVLQAIAQRLQAACRTQREDWPDLVARFGGEEFVLVLPQMPRIAALARVDAIRRAVGATPIRWEAVDIAVTCSMGATLCEDGLTDLGAALKAADAALYRAKHAGRNRLAWQPDLLVPPPPSLPSSGEGGATCSGASDASATPTA